MEQAVGSVGRQTGRRQRSGASGGTQAGEGSPALAMGGRVRHGQAGLGLGFGLGSGRYYVHTRMHTYHAKYSVLCILYLASYESSILVISIRARLCIILY